MTNSPIKIFSENNDTNPTPNPTILVSTTTQIGSAQEPSSPPNGPKTFTRLVDYFDEEESKGSKSGNLGVEEPQIEREANIERDQAVGTEHAEEVVSKKLSEEAEVEIQAEALEVSELVKEKEGDKFVGNVTEETHEETVGEPRKKIESLDWTDTKEEEEKEDEAEVRKESSDDSDDEVLVNMIARMKEMNKYEEETLLKWVTTVSKKAVLPLGLLHWEEEQM
ncbi:hypothetical protein A4A49_29166 [Nicotiana attenuata]|uniref:Uncharacterized protein n=1 Tax=Nicotiana attenuata TaxID=49451 RepID=A0A1J6I038_NICAT|nr:hypothetical protein A4A49_29166 [Nicotiana attenuata]